MFIEIILIWMAIQLNAPTWIFVILALLLVIQTLEAVLKIIDKITKDRLKKQMRTLASARDWGKSDEDM